MLDREETDPLPRNGSASQQSAYSDSRRMPPSPGRKESAKIPGADAQPVTGIGTNTERWILPALRHCYYLTGPTACGKTNLALELAERMDAEILSLDSMAVYRDMDIGTAKPTAEQRQRAAHHLLDIVDPTETYSVSNYVSDAHRVAPSIRERGKNVLVCGGTPLYLKSLLRGLFLGPPADWEFRNAVEEDLKKHGDHALRARLAQVDPLSAHKLHPNDHRRMIRALEVAKFTGKPLSHWQQQFDVPASASIAPAVVLGIDRSWLHERINSRVEMMMEAGLIEETRGLLSQYGQIGRTASQAVGYREALAHLQQNVPLSDTQATIQARTRQFARRQEIWFRGLQELQRIEVTAEQSTSQLADQVMAVFHQSPPLTGHA